jgi:hypothetical protein
MIWIPVISNTSPTSSPMSTRASEREIMPSPCSSSCPKVLLAGLEYRERQYK